MDWVHLHLALNHLPVMGSLFLCGLLVGGCWRRSRVIIRLSLWLLVALTAAAIPIKFTGDFAGEAMGPRLDAFEKKLTDRHEESADQATLAVLALGVAAAITVFLSRAGRPFPKWALALVAVVAFTTAALMARTANLGGQIRHPELRSLPEAPHGRP